jgi:signal peptidase II
VSESNVNGLRKRLFWLALPLAALALDLGSKAWILKHLQLGEFMTIIPGFFNFTLGFNNGAIFGSFQNTPSWIRALLFSLAGLVALGYFGYEFLKPDISKWQRVALGLILGGALGNGIDRLVHGAVVDFLDFYAKNWNLGFTTFSWHYWAFNIADSCILCGAVIYGITLFRAKADKA